jgi:hypothetical protein
MSDKQPAAAAPEPQKAPEFVPLPVPVDLSSVLLGLQSKLDKERELLLRALNDPQLIRDFTTCTRLLTGIQASIRSIDTLVGRTDILGQPIQKQTTNVDPVVKGGTDAAKKTKGKLDKRVPIKKPEADPPSA